MYINLCILCTLYISKNSKEIYCKTFLFWTGC
jgi:hypothetical protein